jgi:ethanolamine utilization protein EutN
VQLGRVIGTVVATIKDPGLDGIKMLVVQPVGRDGRDKGKALVALDSVGAGIGETVYWCRGKEASFPRTLNVLAICPPHAQGSGKPQVSRRERRAEGT